MFQVQRQLNGSWSFWSEYLTAEEAFTDKVSLTRKLGVQFRIVDQENLAIVSEPASTFQLQKYDGLKGGWVFEGLEITDEQSAKNALKTAQDDDATAKYRMVDLQSLTEVKTDQEKKPPIENPDVVVEIPVEP